MKIKIVITEHPIINLGTNYKKATCKKCGLFTIDQRRLRRWVKKHIELHNTQNPGVKVEVRDETQPIKIVVKKYSTHTSAVCSCGSLNTSDKQLLNKKVQDHIKLHKNQNPSRKVVIQPIDKRSKTTTRRKAK